MKVTLRVRQCVGHILEKKNKGALVMRIALRAKQVRRLYS